MRENTPPSEGKETTTIRPTLSAEDNIQSLKIAEQLYTGLTGERIAELVFESVSRQLLREANAERKEGEDYVTFSESGYEIYRQACENATRWFLEDVEASQ